MQERDRHVAHPLDDGCPDYLNRTGNKCNRGKEGRKTTTKKKILGALSGGWRRGLVADYPPRFSSKRNRFGAVMRKRPANKVQTHGDNNRPSILEIYTDECRCQKRFRPLFVYCTRRQLRERKTIIREML